MENSYGLIEIALVFAILLGLLGYELRSVKAAIRHDEQRRDGSASTGTQAPRTPSGETEAQ